MGRRPSNRFASPSEEVNSFRSNLMLLIQNFFPNGLPLVDIQTEYKRFFKDILTPRRLAMLQNLNMADIKDETKEEIEETWEKLFKTPSLYEYFLVPSLPSFQKPLVEKISANEQNHDEEDEVTIVFDKSEILRNGRCKDNKEKKSELELEQEEETAVLEEGMGNNNKDFEELDQVEQDVGQLEHRTAIIFEQNEIENIIELNKDNRKETEMDQQNKKTMDAEIDDGKKQELKDDENTKELLKGETRKTEGKKVICKRGRTIVEMKALAQLASFPNVEYVRKFSKLNKDVQLTRCFRCKDWTPAEENIKTNKKRKENSDSSDESHSDDTDDEPKSKRVCSKHTKISGTEHEQEKLREEADSQLKEIVVVVENHLGEKKTITYMGVEWKCDNCEVVFNEKKILTKHQRECEKQLKARKSDEPPSTSSKVGKSDEPVSKPSKVGKNDEPVSKPSKVGKNDEPVSKPSKVGKNEEPVSNPSKIRKCKLTCEPPSKPLKIRKCKLTCEPPSKPLKIRKCKVPCEPPSKLSKIRKCKVPCEPPIKLSKIRKCKVPCEPPIKLSKIRKCKVPCEPPSKLSKIRKCKLTCEPPSKPSKDRKCEPPSKPLSPFNCRKCGKGFLSSVTLRFHKLNCSPPAAV